MGNQLPENVIIGTIGEILVQLRLLEYGIQAAPPIKDSGNDLIAIKGEVARYLQVKTTTIERFTNLHFPEIYHIAAFVNLKLDEQQRVLLDQSTIYLLTKSEIASRSSYTVSDLELNQYQLNAQNLDRLFSN